MVLSLKVLIMKAWSKLCRSFQYHHIALVAVKMLRVFHPLFTWSENVSPSQGRLRRILFSFLTVASLFFLLRVSPAKNINITYHFTFPFKAEMLNKHSHQLMTHSNSHDRLVDSIGFLKQVIYVLLFSRGMISTTTITTS